MDQKDKALEDLFRPLGEKSKLPSTALTTQYEKKKRRPWTEDLPEIKLETKPPVKKRTPEEEALSEAFRKEMQARRNAPRREGPSLMERAKETASAIYEINAARRAGDVKRLGKAMNSDYKGF